MYKDDNNVEIVTINELNFNTRNNITTDDMENNFITEAMLMLPLYKPITINPKEKNYKFFPYNNLKIECYCNLCKRRRIFTFYNSRYAFIDCSPGSSSHVETVDYVLKKCDYFKIIGNGECDHSLIVEFKVLSSNKIIKIGQYPSIYDMNEEINNKSFIKELGDEFAGYYKSACSLYSFNTCIGALTYLRRIFEKLLLDTFCDNRENLDITEEDFQHLRTDEKVKLLKKYLPSLLFENGFSQIYSEISNGIHNLSEEKCQNIFPLLKSALEEILIQKVELKERENRIKAIASELNKL